MSVEKIHASKKGKLSDKWSSYLSHYDKLFSPIKDKNINLLEIGVQNGGSLETWASYFAQGLNFIGCDVDKKCSDLKFEDERIKLIIGHINSKESFEAVRNLNLFFDIIIDDGSHLSTDIISSFILYFPMLKPGGVFIVEDAHTLYFNNYLGGLYNENSAQKFFHKLTDIINYEFWKNHYPLESILQNWFRGGEIPKFIQDGWVESILFSNSLITIYKSNIATHNKLGSRNITGNEALVSKDALELKKKLQESKGNL